LRLFIPSGPLAGSGLADGFVDAVAIADEQRDSVVDRDLEPTARAWGCLRE
jgi:hypothetical protein